MARIILQNDNISFNTDKKQTNGQSFNAINTRYPIGIYRILNARTGEINDCLENRLKAKGAKPGSGGVERENAVFSHIAKTLNIRQIEPEFLSRMFDVKYE